MPSRALRAVRLLVRKRSARAIAPPDSVDLAADALPATLTLRFTRALGVHARGTIKIDGSSSGSGQRGRTLARVEVRVGPVVLDGGPRSPRGAITDHWLNLCLTTLA